jgi:transcriptional regulator with XRE-family HTH domain
MTPPELVDVGSRLRDIRQERGLSLRALSEVCGLSVNAISLIERGVSSPSVSSLQRLAVALDVPITTFFTDQAAATPLVFVPSGGRATIALPRGRMERLGSGLSDQHIEPLLVTLEAGATSGLCPVVHPGEEFVFCLAGRVAYEVEEEVYTLQQGDSLLFEAHLPHHWRNAGDEPASVLIILYSPEGVRGPTFPAGPGSGEQGV